MWPQIFHHINKIFPASLFKTIKEEKSQWYFDLIFWSAPYCIFLPVWLKLISNTRLLCLVKSSWISQYMLGKVWIIDECSVIEVRQNTIFRKLNTSGKVLNLHTIYGFCITVKKKYCIWETPNLLTDAAPRHLGRSSESLTCCKNAAIRYIVITSGVQIKFYPILTIKWAFYAF